MNRCQISVHSSMMVGFKAGACGDGAGGGGGPGVGGGAGGVLPRAQPTILHFISILNKSHAHYHSANHLHCYL